MFEKVLGWREAMVNPPKVPDKYLVAVPGVQERTYQVCTAWLVNVGSYARPEFSWVEEKTALPMQVEWWMPLPKAPLKFN